jgi:hypothetical protein
VRLSHFDGARDNVPKQADFTWENFAATLGPHEYRTGGRNELEDKRIKEALPCFSPAEYPTGPFERANENVLRVWLFVLDVDCVSEQTYLALVAFVRQLGLAAVVYSTWSHAASLAKTGLYKFRVIVPLDRPVDGSAWAGFWHRANALFGGTCDEACKDPARLFFGPFAPLGTEQRNFYYVLEGGALSVDQVLALPLPASVSDTQLSDNEHRKSKDSEAVALLVAAWPEPQQEKRHLAHRALAGGLLSSGFSDERAVDFLCDVAVGADPDNEMREKRENIVEHTRKEIDKNKKITGWTTLGSIVGYDVVERVRALVERAPDITDEQMLRYAKELKKNKFDDKRELGDALEKVCQQRVIAEPLVLKLAAELGARFVDYNAKSIAARFSTSLSIMVAEGESVDLEQVEKRVKLKQDEVSNQRREQRKKNEQREQAVQHDKASRIREAYKNGRSHPYTVAELQSWAHSIVTGHRWILQRDRWFYFFFNGSYRGPYSEAEAHNAALRELSPASSAGVELYRVTKEGAEFKSLRQLVAEYGTVVERVVTDLKAQVITYDEQDRAIIEAPCPLRLLEPRYDPDVDRWMYELVGPAHYDDLKTWFAILPRLDIIRPALSLIGEHSVGKSLSALGGSRFWTKGGPCTLDQALASFNDSILQCPLVFADEHLPKDIRGNAPTDQLRAFIQATDRPLKRKHQPNSKCLGVTPLIIAAHDLEVLRPSENISNNEVAGSVQRFLIMPVRQEAAYFLANLRPTTHERGWIDNDVITRHFWWLVYNHQHSSKGRFYFAASNSEQAMWFATSGGAKGALLRWLVSYLVDRKKFEGDANFLMLVRVFRGQLLVNIQGVLMAWDKYVGNEKCPSAGLLARMLADISLPQRTKMPNGKGRMTNYRVVITDYLYTWAKFTDLMTPDEIAAELAKDSRETSVGLTA